MERINTAAGTCFSNIQVFNVLNAGAVLLNKNGLAHEQITRIWPNKSRDIRYSKVNKATKAPLSIS
jgi:hypothetical protein